jgi:hypothetical protein
MHVAWTREKGVPRAVCASQACHKIYTSTDTLYLIRNRTYLHSTASWLLQVESRQGHSFLAPMDLFGRANGGDVGLGLGHKLNWMNA